MQMAFGINLLEETGENSLEDILSEPYYDAMQEIRDAPLLVDEDEEY